VQRAVVADLVLLPALCCCCCCCRDYLLLHACIRGIESPLQIREQGYCRTGQLPASLFTQSLGYPPSPERRTHSHLHTHLPLAYTPRRRPCAVATSGQQHPFLSWWHPAGEPPLPFALPSSMPARGGSKEAGTEMATCGSRGCPAACVAQSLSFTRVSPTPTLSLRDQILSSTPARPVSDPPLQ
jgi:hypothetical protein